MGKQLKKIAKYSMAAALATSALVPSAVAFAADEKAVAKDISYVVVKNEQGLIKLNLSEYSSALAFDEIKDTDIQYIVADNGDIFTLAAYAAELAFANSPEEALKSLTDQNAAQAVAVKDGSISEDGKAVAEDETPSTKEDLTKAIDKAKAALEEVEADKKATLQEAIDKAEAVAAKDATAEEITAAVKDLNKAVAEAKGEEEPAEAVAVESVKAINETQVLVTFEKDAKVTEESLKDAKVTLTAGEETLTATYLAESLAEGSAVFVLDAEAELVDATDYTVTADWTSSVVKFTTEFGEAFAKDFTFVTAGLTAKEYKPATTPGGGEPVPASGITSIFVEAVDQYGKAFDLTGSDLDVTVKINGVPQAETTVVGYADGEVQIKKSLAEGNTVEVTVTNTVNEVEYTATKTYTVEKAAAAVPTTISNLKVTDTDGEELSSVVFGDEIKLSVDVRDQYNNKVTGNVVTWVVEKGSVTQSKNQTVGSEVTYNVDKAGDLQISAYLDNGQKVTYTTTVSAKALETLSVADFTAVKNNEASTAEVTFLPAGSTLTPEEVTAEVTGLPTGVKAEDVKVAIAYGKTEETKNKIYATVTTPVNGEGQYKVKFSAAGKSVEKTFTSQVNQTVASIKVDEVKENELQVNNTVTKAIQFFNKHGEKVTVKYIPNTQVVKTEGVGTVTFKAANAEGNPVATDGNNAIAFVEIPATAPGEQSVTVAVNNGTATIKATAVAAGKIKTVTLGSAAASVIQGDSYDAKSKTDNVIVLGVGSSAKAYTLIPVSAVDTYGVARDLKKSDFNLTAPTNAEYVLFSSLEDTAAIAYDTKTVKYIGVHVEKGFTDKSIELAAVLATDKFDTAYKAPKKVITVKDARALKSITVTPATSKLVVGNTTKFVVSGVDQYDVASELTTKGVTVDVAADNEFTVGNKTVENGKVTVEIKGTKQGTHTIKFNSGTVEAPVTTTSTITVLEAEDAIESITVNPELSIKANASAEASTAKKVNTENLIQVANNNVITFTTTAKNGEDTVEIDQANDVFYAVTENNIVAKKADGTAGTSNVTLAFGKNVATLSGITSGESISGTIKVKATAVTGQETFITLNVSNAEAVAQAGTYYFSETNNGLGEEDEVLAPLTSIALTESEDHTTDGTRLVYVVAKDQYGNLVDVDESTLNFTTGNSTTIGYNVVDNEDTKAIAITAKNAASTALNAFLSGNKVTTAQVTVSADAVVAAKVVADNAAADEVKTLIAELKFNDEAKPTEQEVAAVEKAREKYDALTDAQKALVTNYAALQSAEKALEEAAQAAQAAQAELVAAIATANEAFKDVEISTNGNDVDPSKEWTTEEVKKALTDAITTAQGVADNNEATTEQLTQAKTDLGTAVSTYNSAKKGGTKVQTP